MTHNTAQPIPDTEGEWRYVETRHGAEVDTRPIRLRAHWNGMMLMADVRGLMRQIVSDHKAAKSQALLVEALLAVKEILIGCDAEWQSTRLKHLEPVIDAALKAAGVEK